MQLNEKVRKLESELTGTYKDQQASTKQVLELTQKLTTVELEKKELETRLSASQTLINENAENIMEKVAPRFHL
jgi:hypothetical protein